jgi:hypothetical protein
MQELFMDNSIAKKVADDSDPLSSLASAVKSVSILRNGQIEMHVRDDSVEQWFLTDLLEQTTYTVTRHNDGYRLNLASGNAFAVADVQDTADIPEVAHRLAQLIASS